MIINKNYNTKYVCKYYLDDLFTSYQNNVKKEEQDNVRNILYQADLLSIFKIEELNEELISTKIDQIYDIVKEENEFNNCIRFCLMDVFNNSSKIRLNSSNDFENKLNDVIFYDLDTINLNQYDKSIFKKIVSAMD